MKTTFTIFAILLNILISVGQDKFEAFSHQKKSFDLCTGICMSYIETGNHNGMPVLLLHGYTDTSRSFQLLIEDLLRLNNNLRIIAPDLRGHGESGMPDSHECVAAPEKCFSPQQFSEDIIALLDLLAIGKTHVTGHSMGSIIAQNLALNHPDRISSMVLMATFVDGTECPGIQDLLLDDVIDKTIKCAVEEKSDVDWPAEAYSMLPLNLDERISRYLKENWVVEAGAAKELLAAIFPETLRIPLGTWIGAMTALGKVDYGDSLKKLSAPTLILWGEQDVVVSARDQERVKTAFRSAAASTGTKVFYKTYGVVVGEDNTRHDSGHNFHWASHKAVAEDINTFILYGKPVDKSPVQSGGQSVLNADESCLFEIR